MKKGDILTIFLAALFASITSGIILYYVFLEPEKYTGDVSIKVAPEITDLGEEWHYVFEIAAWGEPRDIYRIEIRWLYPFENNDIDRIAIAGSEEEVLTSHTKDLLVDVKSPYKAPPHLKSIWAVVYLFDPENRVMAQDHGLVWIIRE